MNKEFESTIQLRHFTKSRPVFLRDQGTKRKTCPEFQRPLLPGGGGVSFFLSPFFFCPGKRDTRYIRKVDNRSAICRVGLIVHPSRVLDATVPRFACNTRHRISIRTPLLRGANDSPPASLRDSQQEPGSCKANKRKVCQLTTNRA